MFESTCLQLQITRLIFQLPSMSTKQQETNDKTPPAKKRCLAHLDNAWMKLQQIKDQPHKEKVPREKIDLLLGEIRRALNHCSFMLSDVEDLDGLAFNIAKSEAIGAVVGFQRVANEKSVIWAADPIESDHVPLAFKKRKNELDSKQE